MNNVEDSTALSLIGSKFCWRSSLTGLDLVHFASIVFLRALLSFNGKKTLVAGGF